MQLLLGWILEEEYWLETIQKFSYCSMLNNIIFEHISVHCVRFAWNKLGTAHGCARLGGDRIYILNDVNVGTLCITHSRFGFCALEARRTTCLEQAM